MDFLNIVKNIDYNQTPEMQAFGMPGSLLVGTLEKNMT
jgi:hypothetical protein